MDKTASWAKGLISKATPDRLAGMLAQLADLMIVVKADGTVVEVSPIGTFKGRSSVTNLVGKKLQSDLTVESVAKFDTRLAEFLASKTPVRPVELNHSANANEEEFPIRYSLHLLDGDDKVLLIGNDLRAIAELQQQLVTAQIALEKDYEAQREYDARLRVLMAATRKVTFFVSVTNGDIVDCSPGAASLFGKSRNDFLNTHLADYIKVPDGRELIAALVATASGQSDSEVVVDALKSQKQFSIQPTLFRTTGAQMLLCRILDEPASDSRADALREQMVGVFENGTDAIVFVDAAGTIFSANPAFLQLAEVTHAQNIKGRSIIDFLGRGSVDLNVICDNASRTGAMRLYATRLINEFGAEVAIQVATSHFNAGGQSLFAMVIRDASRNEMMRSAGQQVTDVDMRSVIELIGSQTLKDIVAKTTDVIEKMCIETAVDLTSNNRVAAAEMLGLSRQSLYVKLRKYGLIKKDQEDQ